MSPDQLRGCGGGICFSQHGGSVSHKSRLLFADSWMKIGSNFLFATNMHSVKTLVGITYQLLWPIFDLGHILLYVNCVGFRTLIPEWNQLEFYFVAHWCIPSRNLLLGLLNNFLDLYVISRDHDLLFIDCIDLHTHSWMEPAFCYLVHWYIPSKPWLGLLSNFLELYLGLVSPLAIIYFGIILHCDKWRS